MSLRKSLLVSAIVALCAVNARAADAPPAAAAAMPVAAFFAHPQFGGALLSPALDDARLGQRFAATASAPMADGTSL